MTNDHDEQPVDWIPKHLSDDVQQELLALTEESVGIRRSNARSR